MNDDAPESCTDEACDLPGENADAIDDVAFEPGPGKHVLFFGDPMCSWCWGFAPEMEAVADTIKDHAQPHIIMGGLRPGTTESWQGEMQTYVRHHWEAVEKKTGQPFDYARMDDDAFVYDTEPACRAVVCAREIRPESALAVYHALQRGFYAEGKDITKGVVIADIVERCGVEREPFQMLFGSVEMRHQTLFDFQRTRAFGVKGFPSIVCADDGQYAFLTLGYRPFSAMKPELEAWLKG